MRYEYMLTYASYKYAQVLYRRHRRLAALSYYVWIWVVPVAGFIVGVPLIASIFGVRTDLLRKWEYVSGLGLWLAISIPAMRVYSVRRGWKRILPDGAGRSIRTELAVALEFNEEQVISVIPGRSEGRFFWKAIVDFLEDERVALLFVGKKVFLFLPKEALPEVAWSEIRSLVASHVSQRGMG